MPKVLCKVHFNPFPRLPSQSHKRGKNAVKNDYEAGTQGGVGSILYLDSIYFFQKFVNKKRSNPWVNQDRVS